MIYVITGILAGCLLLWCSGYFTGRGIRGDRSAARRDVQAALDWAAAAYQAPPPSYGQFPVDTGPLLIMSELSSAGDAIGRDVRRSAREAEWLIEQGEQRIPGRWR